MIVIGLTGSIAMGKSETAGMFAALGVPVFNADTAVHRLYEPGGAAVKPVSAAFQGVEMDGGIDRAILARKLSESTCGFSRLENIVHPLVRAEQDKFIRDSETSGHQMVVLDIPLLYETERDKDMDYVVVATAAHAIQRERALSRPGMTPEKLETILGRQMPDAEKRRRADFLVDTGHGRDAAFAQVRQIIDALSNKDKSQDA